MEILFDKLIERNVDQILIICNRLQKRISFLFFKLFVKCKKFN